MTVATDDLLGLPEALVYPFAFCFGALWGSFLNVCIVRLPLGRSVVFPGSRCPACDAVIRAYDNIPILSYLLLRGRCRACKAPFSSRYMMVELLMAMLALAFVHAFGLSFTTLAYFLLAMGLIVATFVDLAHGFIPNEVSYLLAIAGLGLSLVPDATVKPLDAFVGAACGGGGLFLVAWIYRFARGGHGLGFGDMKLLFGIGAFVGWKALPLLIFLASAQGVVIALVAFAARRGKPLALWERPSDAARSDPGTEVSAQPAAATEGAPAPADEDDYDDGPPPGRFAIPFGPFLALATFEVIFFGPAIMRTLFGAVL